MKKTPTLIEEIARLVRMYPQNEWDALHKVLVNDELRTSLVDTVFFASSSSKKPDKKRASKRNNNNIDGLDPNKHKLLVELTRALRAKELCSTASSLRNLGDAAGLKDQLSSKRYQAINQLIDYLSGKDIIEIQQLLKLTSSKDRDLSTEYKKWVDHILGQTRST